MEGKKEFYKLDSKGEQKKKELIEMVSGIKDAGLIEYLHTFIKLFLERWS